ncbi:hypothetical protein GCM10020000_70250 [Streptomyces olivoverticillatus]
MTRVSTPLVRVLALVRVLVGRRGWPGRDRAHRLVARRTRRGAGPLLVLLRARVAALRRGLLRDVGGRGLLQAAAGLGRAGLLAVRRGLAGIAVVLRRGSLLRGRAGGQG